MGPPLKAGWRCSPLVGDGGITHYLSQKTYPKISSFHPEIPEFDPGIFRLKSERAINELLSSTVLTTRKIQLE